MSVLVWVLFVKHRFGWHFVIAIKAGVNSTAYDALISVFQRNLRFMHTICLVVQPDPYHMGRGQIIIRDEDGVLCGATEKRTDGQIACF